MVYANQKETRPPIAERAQVFVALGKVPVTVQAWILMALYLHRFGLEKRLDPSVKTSSNLAYFPAVPNSMQRFSLVQGGCQIAYFRVSRKVMPVHQVMIGQQYSLTTEVHYR
jgi:hypothetical protein